MYRRREQWLDLGIACEPLSILKGCRILAWGKAHWMGRHPRHGAQNYSFPHRTGEGGRRPDGGLTVDLSGGIFI